MSLSNTSNFGNISSTAFMASLCRQFTNLPYAKEFAQLVETQGFVDALLSQHVSKAFVSIINLEARYKAISQVITKFQIIQLTDDFMVTMTGSVTQVAEGIILLEIFEY